MKKTVEPFEEIKYIAETFSEDMPVLRQSIRTYMNACLRGTIVILFGAHVHVQAMINAFLATIVTPSLKLRTQCLVYSFQIYVR